jgi:2-polyprenyl-3-methyl-5-hydroxy-6-metoxy-1,4-benzoquinol methylase
MDRSPDVAELLDGPLEDSAALVGNLVDLRRINRALGGVRLSQWGVSRLLDGAASASLLDVGTGGADIPVALLADARRHGWCLTVTAVDSRAEVVAAARDARPGISSVAGLRLEVVPEQSLPYPTGSFDVGHASLVVHHLEPGPAVSFLRELARVASRGIVINDLHRGRLAYLGARLLATVMTRNRFTRHDAPLSVRRAYTLGEMGDLLGRAGLRVVDARTGIAGHRYAVVAVAA